MQEKFIIKIESLHLPDCGTTENVSNRVLLNTYSLCVFELLNSYTAVELHHFSC